MKISIRALSTLFAGAAFVAFTCMTGPACQPSGGDLNTGGSNDEGGKGSGGKTGSGGSGSGGDSEKGGSSGNGGSGSGGSEKGGSGGSNSGGSSAKGGSSGGSGGSANGGSSSSSGGSAAGGSGSGGSSTAGGSGGGSTLTGTTVTFTNGKASGAMAGYGWVSLGKEDKVTDPLCGTEEYTSATTCAATTWSTKDSLCISGSIPALPKEPTDADYTNNWGVAVGVNATEPAGSGIGQAFTTVAITVSGTPTSGLRAQIHKKGDPDGTSYCIPYTTGALTLTKFAQDCYNTTPTKVFAATDIPNIDKVSIQVPSESGSAITVSKLCITKIEFAK